MPVARARLAAPAVLLAPRLLGAVIRSTTESGEVAVRLTEVEAYEGRDDPASHAFRGPTPRTAVMFGPPGHLYCYFTYGIHWCMNIVCARDGEASAVLLRAGEVVRGADAARSRRPVAGDDCGLARGPARLAGCLGVGREQNGIDLCDAFSPVVLESMPARRRRDVLAGPRVGIRAATDRAWRFWLPGEPSVSAYRPGGRKRIRADRHTGTRE
ncbi:MAG: DNA-3-methyladenine glycosylase [Actinomycetota bacterium]|nr:DNA-3-methyladenine glycosylase [Actinomycetota bacterium]